MPKGVMEMIQCRVEVGKPKWGKRVCLALVLCAGEAVGLRAQTFTSILSFDGKNGQNPSGALAQGKNGDFYGTTGSGGTGQGTIYKVTAGGTLSMLYRFCAKTGCTDGHDPVGGLVQDTSGDLYGTTAEGGLSDEGTIFKFTPNGTLTTLYSFCAQDGCVDGALPFAGLIQSANGEFYGTTYEGGAYGQGTIFRISAGGAQVVLYSFCSQTGCADGQNPYGGVIQAADGSLYGTTQGGGPAGDGTIFKVTPSGEFTTLCNFAGWNGAFPNAGLVQGPAGNLYGTTYSGGAYGYGTVFEVTPAGSLAALYSFCALSGCPDGKNPNAGLVWATDGNFYGVTRYGGASISGGTAFRITPSGALTTLHAFDGTDGYEPSAAFVQATNGEFYGTTLGGGANNGDGTIFSLSAGLGPFVEPQTKSGIVGAAVDILGTNLTGATGVAFNGTPAVFRVAAPSVITTTVPAGATSGAIQVLTPSGTLSSNVPFHVLP